MVDLNSFEELRVWLQDRPREDSLILAARSALRLMPLLDEPGFRQFGRHQESAEQIPLLVFRALASTWLSAQDAHLRTRMRDQLFATADAILDVCGFGIRESLVDFFLMTISMAAKATSDDGIYAIVGPGATIKGTTYEPGAALPALLQDAQLLDGGITALDLARIPLWCDNTGSAAEMPEGIKKNWEHLRSTLLAANEGWEVWTAWYENRLYGRPFNKALEEDRVLINADLWDRDAKTINAEIARLIAEYAQKATPQGERLVLRGDTGLIDTQAALISDAAGYDNAVDKVSDRAQTLEREGLQNRFAALRPVIEDLTGVLARHRHNPRRLHDSFSTCIRNIADLVTKQEVPDDHLVLNLQRDMADGVIDIRECVPEVKRMADARAKARMTLPPKETLQSVELILAEAGDAFEPDLRNEIREDSDDLEKRAEGAPDPAAPLEEGDGKDRAYRLYGRLAQLFRMARGGEVWAMMEKLPELREALSKFVDVLQKAEVVRGIIKWLF